MTSKITYRKIRTLKEVINVAFTYMAANARSLFPVFLFYILPFFVVSTLISQFAHKGKIDAQTFISHIIFLKYDKSPAIVLALLFYFAGVTVNNFLLNKHLLINENSSNETPLKFPDLGGHIFKDLHLHFINFFLLCLFYSLLAFLIGVVFRALSDEIFVGSIGEDPLGFLINSLPFITLALTIIPLGFYFFFSSLFVSVRDKLGIFPSLAKVWRYTRPVLLRTWLVSVASFILTWFLNMMIHVPFSLLYSAPFLLRSDNYTLLNILFFIFNTTDVFISLLILFLIHLMSVFQFTNLEEAEEGSLLQEKIEGIK